MSIGETTIDVSTAATNSMSKNSLLITWFLPAKKAEKIGPTWSLLAADATTEKPTEHRWPLECRYSQSHGSQVGFRRFRPDLNSITSQNPGALI